jgi:hypothetical protein
MTVCLQIPAEFSPFLDFYEHMLRNIAQLLTSVLYESQGSTVLTHQQHAWRHIAVSLGVVEDYHRMDGDKNSLHPHLVVPLEDVEHYGRLSLQRWAE